jgi:hypothetical protein
MTPRQVRSSLKGPLAALGFREQGSRFVCELPEVVHQIDVSAVRRLEGCIQIHHEVSTKEQPALSVVQEVASYGLGSAYPRIWASASVDGGLVLEQVSAVCRAFRTRSDLTHFIADAAQLTAPLGREILEHDFSRVPRFDAFALWSSNAETDGYRHLAYVQANETRTLAHIVVFALASSVVAGAFRGEGGMRMLMAATKSVLYEAGRPVLLPMHDDWSHRVEGVRTALLEYMRAHPPNKLER